MRRTLRAAHPSATWPGCHAATPPCLQAVHIQQSITLRWLLLQACASISLLARERRSRASVPAIGR
jgi:hypothetical protein